VTMGLAIGVGGIAAAALGVLADAFGLQTVMWVIAALSVPLFVLARTLPVTRAERRAQGLAVAAAAGAAPRPTAAGAAPRPTAAARAVTAPGSASRHP
jgi:MFS transporter, FSR family, fosmidomycin resistance protein